MAKTNIFWMQVGTAWWLGCKPNPERVGIALHKVPIVDINKSLAARTEHIEGHWIWIGDYLCALFRDPVTGYVYAQPVGS